VGFIGRIILWGLLLLMLKDANSQPRAERTQVVSASTSVND
jgi:hypothetical protein